MDPAEIWSRMAMMPEILPAMIDPTFLRLTLAPPHHLIQFEDTKESNKLGISKRFLGDESFTIMTYNILSDIYANAMKYYGCPEPAL